MRCDTRPVRKQIPNMTPSTMPRTVETHSPRTAEENEGRGSDRLDAIPGPPHVPASPVRSGRCSACAGGIVDEWGLRCNRQFTLRIERWAGHHESSRPWEYRLMMQRRLQGIVRIG